MKVSFIPKPTSGTAKANVVDGVQVNYGPGRRAASRWRWRIVVLFAASPLLYFLMTTAYNALTVDAPGQVMMTTYTLVAPVTGFVTDLGVKPGDRLTRKSRIGKIVDPQLETRLALLISEADDLARRDGEVRNRDTTGLDHALESARENVAYYEDYAQRMERLLDDGVASMAEYNVVKRTLDEARVALGQLEETLPYQGGRVRGEQIEQEIEVLRNQAHLGTALIASQGGQVVTASVVDGQFVMQGTPILELALPDTVELVAYLSTRDLRKAEVGRRVPIRFDDGRIMHATVSGLGFAARQRPMRFGTVLSGSDLSLPITLTPDEAIHELPFGLGFRAGFGWQCMETAEKYVITSWNKAREYYEIAARYCIAGWDSLREAVGNRSRE